MRHLVITVALALLVNGASTLFEAAFQPPRLALTEELRIGSVDTDPFMLTLVSGVETDGDGMVYVLQPEESLVRVFDRAGKPVRTIGRRGEGPGEFLAPAGMGWLGDTLWVRDAANHRISYFARDGRFIRGGQYRVPAPTTEYMSTAPRALLSGGRALVVFNWPADRPPARTFVGLVDSGGAVVDTIAREGTNRSSLHTTTERSSGGGAQPFSDAILVGVVPGGRQVIALDRRAPQRPGDMRFWVTRIDAATGKRTTMGYPYPRVPLPREAVDSALEAQVAGFFRSEFGAQVYGTPARALDLLRAGVYAPAFLPPVTQLVAGRDGTLWVQRWRSDTWLVIGPDGRIVGEATLPGRTTVRAAAGDLVWAVQLDADDVPFIVRYRIGRGR
jgi:hypothetical protein